MNRPHRFVYKFSDDPELEQIERQYFGGNNKGPNKHNIFWIYRTAIFHYSNGANKCCIDGCNASIESLTLEHELFNRIEINSKLGVGTNSKGYKLARALVNAGFPDVNISVKCLAHNMQNMHPEQSKRISKALSQDRSHISSNYSKVCYKCKEKKESVFFRLDKSRKDGLRAICSSCDCLRIRERHLKLTLQAYRLLGWEGKDEDVKNYSFSHTLNDGNVHREYLRVKYNLKNIPSGNAFAQYLIKEYESGVPPWPGLKVEHLNEQLAYKRKEYTH